MDATATGERVAALPPETPRRGPGRPATGLTTRAAKLDAGVLERARRAAVARRVPVSRLLSEAVAAFLDRE